MEIIHPDKLVENNPTHNRYFATLSYKGTNYHGWQVQPNGITVQERIEHALSTILQENIKVTGAGRTDTGVHASYFVLHFDTQKAVADTKNLAYKLNRFLPHDISFKQIYAVQQDAHARFDATSRTYEYYITAEKNPFLTEYAFFYPHKLDIAKMNRTIMYLFAHTDFSCFSKAHTQVKTNNCTIMEAQWFDAIRMGTQVLVFRIKADRFLRNMVRAITGTMLDVGKGKLSGKDFNSIIKSKNRSQAGTSAQAQGLFLTNIEYPETTFIP